MTTDNHDQALEARARELLAREYEGEGLFQAAKAIRLGEHDQLLYMRAIIAALREGQKAVGAEDVCGQAYQAVAILLCDTGQFDTPHGEKLLDNLSQARVVHEDVLPWASITPGYALVPAAPTPEMLDDIAFAVEDAGGHLYEWEAEAAWAAMIAAAGAVP